MEGAKSISNFELDQEDFMLENSFVVTNDIIKQFMGVLISNKNDHKKTHCSS